MFVARRGCPKEERREGLLRVRCDRVRADARAAFFAFLTRRRARPLRRQSNLPRQAILISTNPTDNPRITPASCLEGPTLSTYI